MQYGNGLETAFRFVTGISALVATVSYLRQLIHLETPFRFVSCISSNS